MTSDNFTVRIPPELKSQVQEEADNQRRSKAWIVIAAIRKYLEERKNG